MLRTRTIPALLLALVMACDDGPPVRELEGAPGVAHPIEFLTPQSSSLILQKPRSFRIRSSRSGGAAPASVNRLPVASVH